VKRFLLCVLSVAILGAGCRQRPNPSVGLDVPTFPPASSGAASQGTPRKFLSLLSVNAGAQSRFAENTWERTLRFKENDSIQIFELAIWERCERHVKN
jgi:hypothetical protein